MLLIGVVCATAGPAAAQDETGALAAVDRIFEGMRTADADMVRALFASDARFAMLDTRAQPTSVRVQSVVYDVEAHVDGSMASVWAPYTFYLDGEISHCGINSIELLHDAEGWKVTQISDTRRREGCPDPLGR